MITPETLLTRCLITVFFIFGISFTKVQATQKIDLVDQEERSLLYSKDTTSANFLYTSQRMPTNQQINNYSKVLVGVQMGYNKNLFETQTDKDNFDINLFATVFNYHIFSYMSVDGAIGTCNVRQVSEKNQPSKQDILYTQFGISVKHYIFHASLGVIVTGATQANILPYCLIGLGSNKDTEKGLYIKLSAGLVQNMSGAHIEIGYSIIF